jgi:hypothetical protein
VDGDGDVTTSIANSHIEESLENTLSIVNWIQHQNFSKTDETDTYYGNEPVFTVGRKCFG